MRYWLMKSEPDEFSIDDLVAARGQDTSWFGVRNYQARNYMRDDMQRRRPRAVLSLELPGARHCRHRRDREARASGRHAVRPEEHYYDPKSSRAAPRWFNVDVRLVEKTRLVPLAEMRGEPALAT